MKNMATLEKAIRIAAKAHEGSRDHHGAAYILHPLRLMMAVEDENAKIVAVLHDVVEDTPTTLEDLRDEGFADAVLAALDCVTHREGERYADYVARCKRNPLALAVKLADLRDNSRIDRAILRDEKVEKDTKRWRRYVLSFQYLRDEIDEDEYRERMKSAEK